MKQYESPLLEICRFDASDIITQSAGQLIEDKTNEYDPEIGDGGWQ